MLYQDLGNLARYLLYNKLEIIVIYLPTLPETTKIVICTNKSNHREIRKFFDGLVSQVEFLVDLLRLKIIAHSSV